MAAGPVHIPTLWKANAIAFSSSFCVMVIELIAARILAPFIGVSLYTWTSIIGIILGGIALGNYLGGKIADRYASPAVLAAVFFAGALATIGILPAVKLVGYAGWLGQMPLMFSLVARIGLVFFIPAIILSMVSPLVIKLTLADLGRTGGVVGTIYAFSTVGSVLGTFMTGFFFILWFGTRTIVWLVAGLLIMTGILAWLSWSTRQRWKPTTRNILTWTGIAVVILSSLYLFGMREKWQESFTRESNYYTIRVSGEGDGIKVLSLDRLIHSYVRPDDPLFLKYDYLRIFAELIGYTSGDDPAPRVLHMGGGGYSLPRYLDSVYPESSNEVVEIDPAVTEIAQQELGLPLDSRIRTYNRDARQFLIQRRTPEKYNFIVGDVFNDMSTPYHLTTLEFDRLLKTNLEPDGIYLINIIDDYEKGRYMPSFIRTLKQVFTNVYLFGISASWQNVGKSTFVIAASDQPIDLEAYKIFASDGGRKTAVGNPHDQDKLDDYLIQRNALLLTDDHAPTDILVAPLFR